MIRVSCYIDGFNLYHSIDDMNRASRGALNHLKWLDLKKLMAVFTDPSVHQIDAIKYFSAYATWKPEQHERHQIYVKALQITGVNVILGQFKEKDIYCPGCKLIHKGHEEKESDVNIAVQLIGDAYTDKFDHAFIVSRDSDLSGPIRYIRQHFPKKKVKIIAPPHPRTAAIAKSFGHWRTAKHRFLKFISKNANLPRPCWIARGLEFAPDQKSTLPKTKYHRFHHLSDALGLMAICYEEPGRAGNFNRAIRHSERGWVGGVGITTTKHILGSLCCVDIVNTKQ